MFSLRKGGRAGERGAARGLLAQIAPDRRPGRPDRLAQRFRDDMAVADLDRNRVRLDDEVARLVLLGARKRHGRRGRVRRYNGAIEVLAPAAIGRLKNDNAIREAAGGYDVGHPILADGAPAPLEKTIADYTINIYN
jgi:hypothetical protein